MHWFGPEGHPGPTCKNVKVPTPVGERCLICEQQFTHDALGETRTGYFLSAKDEPITINFHTSCFIEHRRKQTR